MWTKKRARINTMKSNAASGMMATTSSATVQTLEVTDDEENVETTFGDAETSSMKNKKRLPAFLGAALDSTDFGAIPSGHFDNLDKIIGRESGFWSSTPPKLGYSSSTIKKKVTISEFKDALPKHSIFYLFAHGKTENEHDISVVYFEGFNVWNDSKKQRNHPVTPQDISDNIGDNFYNLVFFNGCAGAAINDPTPKEYADAFKAKNYVSWPISMNTTSAANAAIDFFNALDNGNTVDDARSNTKAKQRLPGGGGALTYKEHTLRAVRNDNKVIIDNTPKKK
ncbi:MAG: hypothetical protein FWE99_07235 [Bacteroidales bacterium]|nr:hypothetical protein [Bacteroidales bacterium]